MTVFVSDPPGPIDNSNIIVLKGNTKVLRASRYLWDKLPSTIIVKTVILLKKYFEHHLRS